MAENDSGGPWRHDAARPGGMQDHRPDVALRKGGAWDALCSGARGGHGAGDRGRPRRLPPLVTPPYRCFGFHVDSAFRSDSTSLSLRSFETSVRFASTMSQIWIQEGVLSGWAAGS